MGCQLPPASISFPGPGAAPGVVPAAASVGLDPSNNEGNTASAGRRIGSGRIMSRDERMEGRGEGRGGGGGERGGWNSDYKSGGGNNRGGDSNDNYGDMDGGEYHRGGGGRGGNGGPGGMNSMGRDNKPNSRFFRSNMNNERRMNVDPSEGQDGPGGHGRGGYNNNYRNNNNYGGDGGERGGGGRGYHRNHRYEQEEPEWFTGGPCSQLDTIELHGFDGPAPEDREETGGGGQGRKFKRINDVEKEMKTSAKEEDSERRGRRGNKNQEEVAESEAKEARANKQRKNSGSEGGAGERKGNKEGSFPSSFGQEEESALRKMVPTGSSPIKKPGPGGQMDMRHFEDFLRLEDLLSVSKWEIFTNGFCFFSPVK